MPTGYGQGTPVDATARICSTLELTAPEDIYLLYAKYFFPPEIDAAGFRLTYGIYDPTDGETAGYTFDLQSRIAMLRSLKQAHVRLANALNFFPLPTEIVGEYQSYKPYATTSLRYGFVTTVGDRSCTELELGAPLLEDDNDMWYAEVELPADGSVLIENVVAYEPNTRGVRVPIAWREQEDMTARLYFHTANLVTSAYWRSCGASKTPCDCASINGENLLDALDFYGSENDASGGVFVQHRQCATTASMTTCAEIVNARAGWVIPSPCQCLCVCTATSVMNRAAYSYVSGRWTIDTIPADMVEALVAIAAVTLPEYTLCMEKSMPQHLKNYRELVPDLRGIPRQLGLIVASNAVMAYKQARGI